VKSCSCSLHHDNSICLLYRDNLVGKSLDIYGEYGRDEIELLKQVWPVFAFVAFVCCNGWSFNVISRNWVSLNR
jgi:hypothetical protein